ncbi:MAG: ComEC/Rec2 family competence protein [Gammaproteobacteria bacterium]|nr:ComEC/Rec2 family competence protein [Gammaproteobacteria bacterium]
MHRNCVPGGSRLNALGYVADPDAARRLAAAPGPDPLTVLRNHLSARVERAAGSGAPLLRALLLGDRRALTPEDWTRFAATGTTHLFVVSGLHVGLFAALVILVLRLCGRSPDGLSFVIAVLVPATGYACADRLRAAGPAGPGHAGAGAVRTGPGAGRFRRHGARLGPGADSPVRSAGGPGCRLLALGAGGAGPAAPERERNLRPSAADRGRGGRSARAGAGADPGRGHPGPAPFRWSWSSAGCPPRRRW